MALLNALPALEKFIETLEGDEKIGAQIVQRAMSEPLHLIAEERWLQGDVVVEKVKTSPKGHGLNATGEYVDMK